MNRRWNRSRLAAVLVAVVAVFALCVGTVACSKPMPKLPESDSSSSETMEFGSVNDVGVDDASTDGTSDEGPSDAEVWAAEQLAGMTNREKVGQLFLVRPEAIGYDPVTDSYEDLEACLEQYPVGGFAYYRPNLDNPDQVRSSLADCRAVTAGGVPLLLAVDEEGGTAARLAHADGFDIEDPGDLRDIGNTGDPQAAYDEAVYISGYLLDYGFNLNMAPVADVTDDPEDYIYTRSFGGDPYLVADMVVAAVHGYQDSGMLCCVKHFPGLGGSEGGNSHENIVTRYATYDDLLAGSLIPFQAAVDAGVPMIMTGHIALPEMTGDPELPATLSPLLLQDVLRNDMGYEGVIVTDALEMGGAAHYDARGFLSVYAFQAGADMMSLPLDFQTAFGEMIHAVDSGEISQERLDESVMRILIMKYPLYVQQQEALADAA